MQKILELDQEQLTYLLGYAKSGCTFPCEKQECPSLIPNNEPNDVDFYEVIREVESKMSEAKT